jgi:predicted dienelactone hydrolase
LRLVAGACGQSGDGDTADPTAAPTTAEPPTSQVDTEESPADAARALIDPGPHHIGFHEFTSVDASREDRVVTFAVRYPALTDSSFAKRDAPADRSGAPYPVILTSPEMGNLNGNHYVSHGFVVVETSHPDNDGWAGTWLFDTVFDRLFALDALALATSEPLAEMADTTRAGVIDYSGDTLISIALAGARVDPEFYRDACANAGDDPPFDPTLIASVYGWDNLMANNCMTNEEWNDFEAHAAGLGIVAGEGLWSSIDDPRIKAVIPGGPEGAWLFGERGLAEASVPVLLLAGSEDDINVYSFETEFYFEHLGSPTELITMVGADHIEPVSRTDGTAYLRLFSTAFFDANLNGSASSAMLVSEEYVADILPGLDLGIALTSLDGLYWGYLAG